MPGNTDTAYYDKKWYTNEGNERRDIEVSGLLRHKPPKQFNSKTPRTKNSDHNRRDELG